MRRLILLVTLTVGASYALAQDVPNSGGLLVPNAAGVFIQGPIVAGNCTKWINANTIGDAGAPCGSGGATGCTNQLVFDYSNSCALIAQGWGQ